MNKKLVGVASVIFCFFAVACSSDDETEEVVTSTIGTTGGYIEASTVSVDIPAAALLEEIEITVTKTTQEPPADYEAETTIYEFGPAGTTFEVPIAVTFEITNSTVDLAVFWSNDTGGYDEIGGDISGDTIAVEVSHFSKAFVAKSKDNDDDGDDDGDGDENTTACGDTESPLIIAFNSCSLVEENNPWTENGVILTAESFGDSFYAECENSFMAAPALLTMDFSSLSCTVSEVELDVTDYVGDYTTSAKIYIGETVVDSDIITTPNEEYTMSLSSDTAIDAAIFESYEGVISEVRIY